jgi:transcriptional regulator with XRE-family HTH domain
MAGISETLKADFRNDGEFAEGYAEGFLGTYVATQIKVLREQREMTQKDLADALQTTQTVISRVENVNYSAWNIGTLKKLARAFKVRLHVSFETYGSLVGDVEQFQRERLQRAPRDRDLELLPSPRDRRNSVQSRTDYAVAERVYSAPINSSRVHDDASSDSLTLKLEAAS